MTTAPAEWKQLSFTLNEQEEEELERCETVIQAGRKTFLAVGNALLTIREKRLYRTMHLTFEDYLTERLGLRRRAALRAIEAYEVVRGLGALPRLPENASHVRPLTMLPEEERASAWEEIVGSAPAGHVTTAHVRAVVDRRRFGIEDDESLVSIIVNITAAQDSQLTTLTQRTGESRSHHLRAALREYLNREVGEAS